MKRVKKKRVWPPRVEMTISRWGSKNRDFLGREEPNEAKPSGESSAQNVSNFESTHLEMGFSSRILGRNEFF